MKTWAETSDEMKGALLLAHHNGRAVECYVELPDAWMECPNPSWITRTCYRLKPEPAYSFVDRGGERFIHEDALKVAIAELRESAIVLQHFDLVRKLETCLK